MLGMLLLWALVRPPCWASARVMLLEEWFKSSVPESVYGAGGGRSSIETCCGTTLAIEASLLGRLILMYTSLLLMWFDPSTLLIGRSWIGSSVVLDCLLCSSKYILSIMLMFGYGFRLLRVLDPGWWNPTGMFVEYDVFFVALHFPWCRYLEAQWWFMRQLHADNVKCVSSDPEVSSIASRFAAGYVRLVGQELALGKCVLMCTSGMVRKDLRDWIF